MTQQPDDDVIIYECGEFWEIRIGAELHGLRFTLEAAIEHARGLAAFHRKPAWLVDKAGYPDCQMTRKVSALAKGRQ